MQLAVGENGSLNSELFQVGDKAPLVCLQDICSAASIDNSYDRISKASQDIVWILGILIFKQSFLCRAPNLGQTALYWSAYQ